MDSTGLSQQLPKYFKTNNYASFVRQLNIHKFGKVKHKEGTIEFKHEKFIRDNFENNQTLNFLESENMIEDEKSLEIKDRLEVNAQLKTQIIEMEEKLKIIKGHIKFFVDSNSNLLFKLYRRRSEFEIQTLKFLLSCLPFLKPECKEIVHKFPNEFKDRHVSEILKSSNGSSVIMGSKLSNYLAKQSPLNQTINKLIDKMSEFSADWLLKNGIGFTEPSTVKSLFDSIIMTEFCDEKAIFKKSQAMTLKLMEVQPVFQKLANQKSKISDSHSVAPEFEISPGNFFETSYLKLKEINKTLDLNIID